MRESHTSLSILTSRILSSPHNRWNVVVVLLLVTAMLGCQVLSSANKTPTTPPNQQNPKPGQLTDVPASISFSGVKVGNNQSQPATMSNSGGSTLTVTQVSVTGAGFSVSGLSLPLILAAGQSQAFTAIFARKSAGTINGNLAIANTGSTPLVNVPLSGNGLAAGVLTANPSSLDFGNVTVGNTQPLPETLTNSGGSSITVTQITPTGAGYSVSGLSLPFTLAPGQSQPFSVIFAPQSAGHSNGNLAIANTGSTPLVNVPLSGNGLAAGVLTANPSSLDFGNVTVGNNQPLPETLTNSGGANVSISQATISGTGFSMSGLNPPLVLTPGQHFTFNVIFAPPATGSDTGSVSVVSDASNPNLAIPLTGTGTAAVSQGQLAVNPASLNFGNVVVGNNSSLPASLQASGASVTVTSASLSNPAFTLSGISFPVTIQAGEKAGFMVTFTPPSTGQASATASFTSDASNSPTVESLTGTGNTLMVAILPNDKAKLQEFNTYVMPHISAVEVRVDWSQIESTSTQGLYDFTALDAAIDPWTQQGKKVAVIISLNNDSIHGGKPDTAAPDYIYTANWAQQCCGAPPLDTIQCKPTWSPFPAVYEEPFVAAAEPFLAAVMQHLDQNPNIVYVRAGYVAGGENSPPCHTQWPGWTNQRFLNYFTEMTNFVAGLKSTTRFVNSASGLLGNSISDAEADILHGAGVGIGMQVLSAQDKTNYDQGKPCANDWCAWATKYPNDYRYLQPDGREVLGDPTIYIPFAESFGINALEIFPQDMLIAFDPKNPNYQQYHQAYQQAFGLP